MGAGSVAYSGPGDRVSGMSTVFTNVGGNAVASNRHTIDAALSNIEPNAGQDFDALAEAKPHTIDGLSTPCEPALVTLMQRRRSHTKKPDFGLSFCFLSLRLGGFA
jgi:hypothetical protein